MTVDLSESQGAPLPQYMPSVSSVIHRFHSSVGNHPQNIALICTHQSSEHLGFESQSISDSKYQEKPYLRWDFQTLENGVDRLVAGLQASGVSPGTPIVTFLPNSAEYVLTLLASYELGCTIVPINPRNLQNEAEVLHMLKTVSIHSSGKSPVFIAMDRDTAQHIDRLPGLQAVLKIVAEDESGDGWDTFTALMSKLKSSQLHDCTNGSKSELQGNVILFTSGTTSLPKGCVWTTDQLTLYLEYRANVPGQMGLKSIWCGVVPNNHAMNFLSVMYCICYGASIAFPGPVFAPEPTMATLQLEKCTHASFVPTMIHALSSVQAPKLKHLENLTFGGSIVTKELIMASFEQLGTKLVESAYGMTEGVFVFSGGQTEHALLNGVTTVGRTVMGSRVKICEPGLTKLVPRMTPGDLHYSGGTLCKGYIGMESDDFYTDDKGVKWFITGDQAVMDEEELIYITGRYKEMIIRGGENISPAAIETVVAKNPRLAELIVLIVGVADSIAGEVPVAVTKSKVDSDTAQEIHKQIHDNMGKIYLLDEVISLQDLGLTDFPSTMAGKIQKGKLSEAVRKYREDRDKPITNVDISHIRDNVKKIWARAVGLQPDQLNLEDPITNYADSITVMRVKDKIGKEIGRSLSLAEMMEAGNLEKQIQLLEQLPAENVKGTSKKSKPERQGGPAVEDMAHLTENPEFFSATKDAVVDVIEPYGLGWDDVMEVLPAYDFASVLAETRIFDSWNFKMSFLPKNVDEKKLRAVLELVLKTNPMLASFFIIVKDDLDSSTALHVMIKHTRQYLDQVIEFGGTVKTLKDLQAFPIKYPAPRHAMFPGPMFRALVYYVEETKSCALLCNVNHAVIDASFTQQIWMEDFDKALQVGVTHLDDHVDYKQWADSYYLLRNSPEARVAIKWHVKRLKALASHKKAVYPTQPKRAPWDPALEADGEDGQQYNFEAPDILILRRKNRNLSAPIPLKAAYALLNIQRTGHTHALFSNLEAARATFPFVPKSMAHLSQFEASDVAGPTIESVINLVEIKEEETVLEFFHRIQEDQTNLTKFASAPLKEIIAVLGKEAGDMIPLITQTSVYNWVPGMGTTGTEPYANFKVLNAVVRPEVALAVNAGLGGPESSTMFLHLRGDGLDNAGLKQVAVDLEKITKWLVDPVHWNVAVAEFVEALK